MTYMDLMCEHAAVAPKYLGSRLLRESFYSDHRSCSEAFDQLREYIMRCSINHFCQLGAETCLKAKVVLGHRGYQIENNVV